MAKENSRVGLKRKETLEVKTYVNAVLANLRNATSKISASETDLGQLFVIVMNHALLNQSIKELFKLGMCEELTGYSRVVTI